MQLFVILGSSQTTFLPFYKLIQIIHKPIGKKKNYSGS